MNPSQKYYKRWRLLHANERVVYYHTALHLAFLALEQLAKAESDMAIVMADWAAQRGLGSWEC